MGELTMHNLGLRYGKQWVIRNFSLEVKDGEMVSILGPSGAGKTSILKAVSGLIFQEEGEIRINGVCVTGLAPEKRDAVMVFQKPLLFPFYTVYQNIAFGLWMKKMPKSRIRETILEILALTRLEGLENRMPEALSGGQQQRVALARALVVSPSVLLLDEPLSNLDAALRRNMRELIRDIQKRTGITTLFVTHDQAEALTISHRVGLLLGGRLRQTGKPEALFYRPCDRDVAAFFGGTNFFSGVADGDVLLSEIGPIPVSQKIPHGKKLTATIRPEEILVGKATDAMPGEESFSGVVEEVHFEGPGTRMVVALLPKAFSRQKKGAISSGAPAAKPKPVTITVSRVLWKKGDRILVHLPKERMHLFPEK